MATKLGLYNGCLQTYLGERKLASLSENREPRRVLDDIYDDGLIDYCLGQGLWNHAKRTAKISYSPSIEPEFGYRYAFDKPADWIRTAAFCSDEYFNSPITQYSDEAQYWFCDLDDIYVQYISNDAAFGGDLSLWPETFTQFVECYMAFKACGRITGSNTTRDELRKECRKLLIDARSKDAMNEGAKFLPSGTWLNSRRGNRTHDRPGSRLIG